jgi:hypothetical protein
VPSAGEKIENNCSTSFAGAITASVRALLWSAHVVTGRKPMVRIFMIAAASAAVLTLSPTAFAQQPSQLGTADEAKAMLAKAVSAVKADKTKALDMFAKGEHWCPVNYRIASTG